MTKQNQLSYFSLSIRWLLGLIALTSILFYSPRAEAAEWVVLKYRFLRERVSVTELTTFVKTGELSRSLRAYLKLAKKEPAELRRTLTQEVKVNSTFLYQALKTPVGDGMLDQVSQVVHTPTNRANRESLRGALVSSALPDGNITLIETLQNYPTPEVHVEGERLVEVMQNISKLLGGLPLPRS
ncbi:alpha/beta hydrolase [Allocoleopsis sp.]|uniref:alpha/beta hydrolase n=1 Tax=Allocoleopsis sp. TaxID=3088169 RepID=UPI002FD277C3